MSVVLPVCSACGADVQCRIDEFYDNVVKLHDSSKSDIDRQHAPGRALSAMGIRKICCRRQFLSVVDPTALWHIKRPSKK